MSTIRSDLQVGDRIHTSGYMSTNTVVGDPDMTVGERYISSQGLVELIKPVGMCNKCVGNGFGLSTVGKWIRAFGQIVDINTNAQYIDVDDGSNSPVRVSYSGYTYALPALAANDFISFSGHVAPGAPAVVTMVNGDDFAKY